MFLAPGSTSPQAQGPAPLRARAYALGKASCSRFWAVRSQPPRGDPVEAGDPFTCALWLRSAASAPVVGRIPGSARVSKSHLDKYLLSECLRQEPRSVESQGALANGRSSPYSKRGCRAHSLPGQRAGAPLKLALGIDQLQGPCTRRGGSLYLDVAPSEHGDATGQSVDVGLVRRFVASRSEWHGDGFFHSAFSVLSCARRSDRPSRIRHNLSPVGQHVIRQQCGAARRAAQSQPSGRDHEGGNPMMDARRPGAYSTPCNMRPC